MTEYGSAFSSAAPTPLSSEGDTHDSSCSFVHAHDAGRGRHGTGEPDPLSTRPERTNFEETSRYADLDTFLKAIAAKSSLVRTMSFGTTEEGRAMPLVTLSNPAVARPADKPAGRPVVFLLANIHGGEVEGKEAVQVLMRRLTGGDLRPLLDRMVVVIAPNYNADGNEAVDVMNRTAQYGPVAGVGRRENVKGLDLNRDYMKLESAEARALAAAFTAWDPHLVVDLHTTNGSYHGYHLTQSIPLNLSLSARILDYHRQTMMPAIMKSLEATHKTRTYYYGNFGRGNAAPGALRRWNAFDWRPRAGQNYVGFRNRLTILSEAYSYLSFKRRIEVTERFVEEILKYVDGHRAEILALTKALDDDWIKRAQGSDDIPLGVEYELKPLPKPVEILVGEVRREMNPRNQREMTVAIEDSFKPELMEDYAYVRADADREPRARLRRAQRPGVPATHRQGPPARRHRRDPHRAAQHGGVELRRRRDRRNPASRSRGTTRSS